MRSAALAEAVVRFQFRGTESELGELPAWLVGAGVRVTQFRELGTDLEDAFLSIVQNNET
ncbi:MAG: hypothetical protein ABIK89_09460 [Planctomycetota bacterium]